MADKIICAVCIFARQDRNASEYSVKHCGKCKVRESCEVCSGCKKYDTCKSRKAPNRKQSCERRLDTVCSRQSLKWAAYRCTNSNSEYYKALLNVSPSGDMQSRITWSGCAGGERRCFV